MANANKINVIEGNNKPAFPEKTLRTLRLDYFFLFVIKETTYRTPLNHITAHGKRFSQETGFLYYNINSCPGLCGSLLVVDGIPIR
jgi:hypothetical protein